ncbi:MAG: gamma-glutamylcyclotransferase [Acidiferrobacterales bacterium]|nr:gamma-glutamylcyclotransferase [Acidiferrobacterales bacterium]
MQFPKFNLDDLIPGTVDSIPVPEGEFWVFTYGSLMWNPGFKFVDSSPGIVHGYHRKLCLWSVRYRGTVDQPGLVLGLARGGSCRGFSYRIDRKNEREVLNYLCDRELITGAYAAQICQVTLESGRKVNATTFVSKPDHPHFARGLADDETIKVVNSAKGFRGCNREYVINTVDHLTEMNIRNTELHKIARQLDPLS